MKTAEEKNQRRNLPQATHKTTLPISQCRKETAKKEDTEKANKGKRNPFWKPKKPEKIQAPAET